jgi:DNA-binding NarL/FixJ family response regulator
VLLADDHTILLNGLRIMLKEAGIEVVGEASDGYEAIRLSEKLTPDIGVLEICMPLLNGIDAAREISKVSPQTKIVFLTIYAEDRYVLAALRVGAAGYVLKTNAVSSLLQAIDVVSKGEFYLSPGVSGAVVDAYLMNKGHPSDPMSIREREVLQLIAEGKNVKEIGTILGISTKTAESHRGNLMQKLNIHELAGLVRYAIREGLVKP